jgi:hypothetical protein
MGRKQPQTLIEAGTEFRESMLELWNVIVGWLQLERVVTWIARRLER